MSQFDVQAYGPVLAKLLETDRRRPLDAGKPNASARAALEGLSVETAFAHAGVVDGDMASCCVSAVWLVHDYLNESHAISQEIDTPSSSFWHGILHRREGDFSNAKYWFRRVEKHPVLDQLGQRAGEMAAVRGEERIVKKLISGAWDPMAFVDLCESVVGGHGNSRELCLDIQQAEWELLFDHCYRGAVGDKNSRQAPL
jgi:hypothetical protein